MLKKTYKIENSEQLSEDSPVLSSEADQKLMLQVRRGDVRAFQQLYDKYKGPIMSYIYSTLQNKSIAEELAHEVFLKVYRVRESYEPKSKFTTWLWTIARNTVIDQIRKDSGHQMVYSSEEGPEIVDQIESPLLTAENLLIEQVDQARLESCVSKLSTAQREALSLRTMSDLSYDEISKSMNLTVSSVKSLLFRAKDSLIKCLKKGGGES